MPPHFDCAFTGGRNGYQLGYKREQNPYPVWSDKFINWDAGWRFGERVFPKFSPPPAPPPQPPPLPVSGEQILLTRAIDQLRDDLDHFSSRLQLIRSALGRKTGS
jgi:hypothetical protein